ncbi:hypothetical protein NSU_1197 [Novosphingobium pentaromativorans US6-1]|uniref:Uncharacterized protein n=1 Tax=Novosphingobium pentaromativorans US6-1 TaxID=1088721 RepID=G6EA27_9SPHN|nr:hypothetical protein NSU_1197 [Novosphingobium pentaromativorans US6-1]
MFQKADTLHRHKSSLLVPSPIFGPARVGNPQDNDMAAIAAWKRYRAKA